MSFTIMNIREIKDKIRILKKNFRKIETNFYPGMADDLQEAKLFENEKALVFIIAEPNRNRAFFAFADTDSLIELLLKIPEGTVIEYVCKKENPLKDVFINNYMEHYATYIRDTICYSDNPFTIPEKGRRKLLTDMYDPTCGEYAQKKDIVQLYKITRATFDPLCDDVFSMEEWHKIIDNKECILYREDDQIIAFYVYRLEGKKLYSNLSVNRGAANYLYNLERRIFEEMYNKGIRIFYAWYNSENFKELRRGNPDAIKAIKSQEKIYNYIFIKNKKLRGKEN